MAILDKDVCIKIFTFNRIITILSIIHIHLPHPIDLHSHLYAQLLVKSIFNSACGMKTLLLFFLFHFLLSALSILYMAQSKINRQNNHMRATMRLPVRVCGWSATL